MKQLIIGDFRHELAATRRILEVLPEEHMSWRPHAKSMTLSGLATHIISLLGLQIAMFISPEFDFSTTPLQQATLATREDMLKEFDTSFAKLEKLVAECEDSSLSEEWTLRNGDHIIARQPRALALRSIGISHMIHHRAQLGVYLRLLDIPVPGFYGPSSDEHRH